MVDKNKNNPRNPTSDLYRKLTRLLSGPITGHRRQLPRKLRKKDLDKYRSRFKSASGQQFKRAEFNPYDVLQYDTLINQNRAERYIDFDQMEYTPEIASALDIYADEMTTSSELTPLLTIKCPNEEIKFTLENLYTNVMNIKFNLFGWCRTMCKYGDYFLYLDIDEEVGVKHVIGLPPTEIERLEGEDKTNPDYVQYQWNSAGITLENWQLAHFRILGNDKYAPYGSSVLEASRRIWRQLTLMEDAVMAYRIVRSPERRVFYIDVGNVAPEDVEQYMQRVMTQMKRHQLINPSTGKLDLRYNPMSIEEDYYIPIRGGVSSRIESLSGGSYTGDIDDIKYLRDKLFSALKIPASYLSRTEGGEEDKTTLAQKDIRFARTIQRLQRSIVAELEKIGVIHLFTLGFRGDDLVNFKLSLNNPSRLAEMQELENWRTKFEVAGAATEGYFSRRWISDNIFNLADEEIVRMHREMFYDRKFDAALEAAAAGEQEADTGGGLGGGDLGGGGGDLDLGGDLDAETPDEETPETPEPPAGEDEGPLLATPGDEGGEAPAPPAKRDDGYVPVAYQKGKIDQRTRSGPRLRNMKAQWNHERRGRANRAVYPGEELKRTTFMVYEDQQSNYNDEQEKNIFDNKNDIKKLIENLESK